MNKIYKLLDRWNLFIGGKIRPFHELIFKRQRISSEKVSKKEVDEDEKISTKGVTTGGDRNGETHESGSRGRGRRR